MFPHNRQPQSIVTLKSFKLDFFIPKRAWYGLWDRLEVWRSRSTPSGPYDALNGDTWTPATLPLGSPTVPPSPPQTGAYITIVGTTITFLVDEASAVSITFTGTDPLTLAQVATQIAAQSNQLLSSYVDNGQVIAQTIQPGEISVLRCTGGTAAPLLGFPTTEPGSVAFGLDARIVLLPTQELYSQVDANGNDLFFYKTRFYNSSTGLFSDYSLPSQAISPVGISPDGLVRCYVELVDLSGSAIYGAEVLIESAFGGLQVEGKTVVGGQVVLHTDRNGHAELLIPRGTSLTVAIGGTDLVRDVVVPTDSTITAFNLLAPGSGTNDVFAVAEQNIDYAVRRSI